MRMVRNVIPLATLLMVSVAFGQVQQPQTRESLALPSLSPLVDSVKSAVVNVDVQARSKAPVPFFEDPFQEFFGRQPRGRQQLRQGTGSGFIIDPKGLVLTNNHVVEGAVSIRVRLDDGRAFNADIVGRDPLTDLAVIKMKGELKSLPVVKLGDSDALRVGDWVVAIGNPFGLASSVSLGIISAKARQIGASQYDDFLQTDAAINPGNSGGPLFNMKGEVIGINTAIVGGGAGGIGFAVPSNLARALLPQLEKEGVVTRGWLGIGIQDLSPELAKALNVPVNEGAVVTAVNDGSPAKKAGLRADDVITMLDGQKVNSDGDLSRNVALKRPGTKVSLTVYRAGKELKLTCELGTRPDLEGKMPSREKQEGEEERQQQRIGIVISDVDPRVAQSSGLPAKGALVTEVLPGSPAERAGLQPGLVVTEAAKKLVKDADDLLKVLKGAKSGEVVLLRAQTPRNGGSALFALTIP